MTLPSTAYRGHAAPTWDTRTLQQVIDYLAALPAPANGYPSTFADVQLPGATNAQILPFATAQKINLNNELSDPGNNFSTASSVYTCPSTGIYFCHGVIRLNDATGSAAGGPNLGMGIYTSEDVADTSFLWHKLPQTSAGTARAAVECTRVGSFTSGSQLRLYAFWDSGSGAGSAGLYSARMQIYRTA